MCHNLLKDLEVFFVSKTLFNKEIFKNVQKKMLQDISYWF